MGGIRKLRRKTAPNRFIVESYTNITTFSSQINIRQYLWLLESNL